MLQKRLIFVKCTVVKELTLSQLLKGILDLSRTDDFNYNIRCFSEAGTQLFRINVELWNKASPIWRGNFMLRKNANFC